jgi:hypothetical protein
MLPVRCDIRAVLRQSAVRLPCSNSESGFVLYFRRFSNSATICRILFRRSCAAVLHLHATFGRSLIKRPPRQKPSPSGRAFSRVVISKPHMHSLTTFPGKAGWYDQNPILDARSNFGMSYRGRQLRKKC